MKRRWERALLTCTVRRTAEEAVLTACKLGGSGSSPQDGFAGCFTGPCYSCDSYATS
jgi:hypothetical protein